MSKPEEKIICVRMGLMGCWFCASLDATEKEIIDEVWTHQPAVPRVFIRDRLYGGFRCEFDDRRHIWWNAGAYSYTNPEFNSPRYPEERKEDWTRLLEENKPEDEKSGFIGGGLFLEDCPELATADNSDAHTVNGGENE